MAGSNWMIGWSQTTTNGETFFSAHRCSHCGVLGTGGHHQPSCVFSQGLSTPSPMKTSESFPCEFFASEGHGELGTESE